MPIEQSTRRIISIETTSSSFSPGENLAVIKQFLSARLTDREEGGRAEAVSEIVIDIRFMGIRQESYQIPDHWKGKAIYPIRVHFSTILLGPLYYPVQNASPCPSCLELRWVANRTKEEQWVYQDAQKVLPSNYYPKLHSAALESLLTVVETELYLDSFLPRNEDGKAWFYSLQLDTLVLQRHLLIADSSCAVCAQSEPDSAEAATIRFTTRLKKNTSNYRLVDPLDYHLPDEGYINTISGMLGTVSAINLAHTVTAPVTGAFYLTGKKTQDMNTVWWGGHSTKFHTSQRIGMLEGLERYCSHWSRTKQTVIIDSYNNLAPDALDPLTCGLYKSDTYVSRVRLQPYTPESKFAWVWGYSFRQSRPILVPEQLAYYFPQTIKESFFVLDTSSGCAIGSCLEEAILHGLLELVERDNFLIHWYAKLAAPRIDPWSSHDLKTLRLLDRIDRLGYDMYFLDTRLDLPFQTVTAVGVLRNDDYGKLVLAAGASLDPEGAIRAALCEVAAYIPSLSERVKADLGELQPLVEDHTKVATLEQHPLIYGIPEMAKHAYFLLQNPCVRSVEEIYAQWNKERSHNADLSVDLQYSIDSIIEQGMDVIVVDQTSPELEGTGLKVVRVIVPGLVPIDFGWGRHRIFNLSRLRTVPRTAGYCETDFDLTMLNLTPHPFP